MNTWLLHIAERIGATWFSVSLHESYYAYAWVESIHVITLMISLGMLIIIDLRMLGLWLTNVPASTIAQRLDRPMLIGFSIMVVTGVLLYVGIPIRTTQSLWFRIKMILLVAAFINAWLFRRHMQQSVGTWDVAAVPPRRTRIAAALSLTLWAAVVMCGRFIAYDWFDCGQENSAFIDWAAGCVAGEGEAG
ncbi:MAG TPA: DUF6644 family protein [Steroidobacteraceae bacterium]|jgi:uncharacterized protein DUF6644|nr:DUF6644 family protein [Steroidobacteraceae bacterium]